MKVLFAVNSESISDSIVKAYQKQYREIISYKNVYYFNAILKELQRDRTYDRIVISEDLEPFANNNYEAIDKFIFEKLDSISDEATNGGGDTPIVLICTDRRAKSESILVKLFGIGIYNALLGRDRTVDQICALLSKPRSKKEAKQYYKIDAEEVNYQNESEDSVSEIEIQNILTHYKRLGKNTERYIESFNNIAAQYTDAQLRVISRFLPLSVKAVLEAESPKYQSIMTFSDPTYSKRDPAKKEVKEQSNLKIGFIENSNTKNRLTRPVIVPSAVDTKNVKKLSKKVSPKPEIKETSLKDTLEDLVNDIESEVEETTFDSSAKRRGRPRKNPIVEKASDEFSEYVKPRRRGRPRKVSYEDEADKLPTLPGFEDIDEPEEVTTLSGFEDIEEEKEEVATLPGFEDLDNEKEDKAATLPGFEEDIDESEEVSTFPGFENIEEDEDKREDWQTQSKGFSHKKEQNEFRTYTPKQDMSHYNDTINNSLGSQDRQEFTSVNPVNSYNSRYNNLNSLFTKDKKVVSFVGTTKNGTSFIVNNLALVFSNMGIKTAILDVTKNKNSYYIYTKNEETLREIAYKSFENLRSGIAQGIDINKNLTVFTSLPEEDGQMEDVENILSTLVQNYSLVLLDTDFSSPLGYFENSQEIYLVQSMDILTIQPLTAFLRDLKAKNVIAGSDKVRIVLNKEVRMRGVNAKTIIGGMSFYNDPAMSFMTELFNKDNVKYCTIPFDEQAYVRYLEGLVDCTITLNGYSKMIINSLKELANMVYPMISNKYRPQQPDYSKNNKFSANMNSTLEKMKRY